MVVDGVPIFERTKKGNHNETFSRMHSGIPARWIVVFCPDRHGGMGSVDTYLLGSGTVTSFRASVTRTVIEKAEENIGAWPDYGVKAKSLDVKVIQLQVTGNGFGNSGFRATFQLFTTASTLWVLTRRTLGK